MCDGNMIVKRAAWNTNDLVVELERAHIFRASGLVELWVSSLDRAWPGLRLMNTWLSGSEFTKYTN